MKKAFCFGVVCAAILASGPLFADPVRVKFEYFGSGIEVRLAGSFNDWNAKDPAMIMSPGKMSYLIYLELEPGTYSFKFIVDGKWIADMEKIGECKPLPVSFEDDGFGGKTAVFTVKPKPEVAPNKE